MNFELSEEQEMLCEAAREALARTDTLAAARAGLDGRPGEAGQAPAWGVAVRGGWTGLLADEDGRHELGALNAMLVLIECGRRLAATGLVGHLAAVSVLHAAGADLSALASGRRRAVYVPARPPVADEPFLVETGDPARPYGPLPELDGGRVTGRVAFVPDLPGADLLVVPVRRPDGVAAVLVEAGAGGVKVEPLVRGDATRPLGHLTLDGAEAAPPTAEPSDLERAWDLAQALTAAEALGVCEAVQEMAVGYARDRSAFGRPIGSYQAVKHQLVDILRYGANVRALLYYAGYAAEHAPDEFTRAAGCARVAGEHAAGYATRTCIAVHGGIGATWEHDAHLFYRRALLSRLLYGGEGFAAERVALDLLAGAFEPSPEALARLGGARL
ncbi:acyl-CoA dehydrogenase family protein [Actinomadura sp. K4S16]|uniref:acyl-CoA dehydrogenase family protein n=1 Tax=Actinomadura sp. K4S16 TaxID=1316147 RepID=UPI0011ED633B|nr:acyl-CoA dehydrogenase family protein [Actinomadura sp. K4S16]